MSILCQRGHKITMEKSGSIDLIDKDSCNVFVDSKPLHLFLKENLPELAKGGMHEMVKENIYTITKIFDKRVRDFISKIIQGKKISWLFSFHSSCRDG